MKRTDHIQEAPNFAGVSLALYLLVCVLSMMAAYEVGKASDDVRNSVVVSLQSSNGTPSKSSDGDRDDPFILPALEPVWLETHPQQAGASFSHIHLELAPRAFNARAPPMVAALAA